MENKGHKAERELLEYMQKAGNEIAFKNLKGNLQSFPIEEIKTFGHTTSSKVDITINSNCRLQVKSVNSNRATIINKVPARNFHKLAKREMLDTSPALELFQKLEGLGTVKLSRIAKKEDWEEMVKYFIFEGSATRQADKYFQATHLLEIGNEMVIIDRTEVLDYIWEKLTVELRVRKGKEELCLNVRVGK